MTAKADFLRECMSDPALVQGPVPMDEFNKAYCVRCIQKDCSRAGLNGSLFARRTATWKENLFEKPPRAADGDPRFESIRAKKFLQVARDVVELRSGGVNYEVQTHEMPDLPPALRKPAPEPSPEPPRLHIPTFEQAPPAPTPPATPEPPPPPPAAPVTRPNAPLQNTAFEQGTVLPGARPASEEKVQEVGGSYVFGSDE